MIATEALNQNVALEGRKRTSMILRTISDPNTTAGGFRRVTAERDKAYWGVPCESNPRKPFVSIYGE